MPYTSITIIVSPYHVGIYDHRVGGGPLRILSHGLADKLESLVPIHFANIGPVDKFEGEVGKTFEIMRRISTAVSTAVEANSFPLVLAGNCYASAAVAAGLNNTIPDMNMLWIDAHDDLDTPSSNENGYLDSMALSMAVGTSWQTLMKTVPGHKPLSLDRVAHCGLRDISELQRKTVKEAGVDVIWGNAESKVNFPQELAALLDRKRFEHTHVHLDLDVLDESLGWANDWPSPGGLDGDDLLGCLQIIPRKSAPTSMVVCSFDPRLDGGDTIARIAVKGIVCFVEELLRTNAMEGRKGTAN